MLFFPEEKTWTAGNRKPKRLEVKEDECFFRLKMVDFSGFQQLGFEGGVHFLFERGFWRPKVSFPSKDPKNSQILVQQDVHPSIMVFLAKTI